MFREETTLRISRLEREMAKAGLDSMIVDKETNVSYLSGFFGHDSILLITRDKRYLITDSRYKEEAESTAGGYVVIQPDRSSQITIRDLVRSSRLKKVGFEAKSLSYETVTGLMALIGTARLKPTHGLVEKVRSVKSSCEINAIKKSVYLAGRIMNRTIRAIKPGAAEETLARSINTAFIEEGAVSGFEPIVACGPRSSMPHARPGKGRVKMNDAVMIDLGCKLDGYNSDITRLVPVGKANEAIKKAYDAVRDAQDKAIKKIRPGIMAMDVDLAAREHIDKMGYGKYFGHAVGHGIGMEVHEEPSISPTNGSPLKPGMVFTVEPAVYIPGIGGVRLEDDLLVTDKGYAILSR